MYLGGEKMAFPFDEIFCKKSSWEKLQNSKLPIAVYGTGNGADMVFNEFDHLNIVPAGVVASDGFVRNRTFHGYTVKSISDFSKENHDFVIALVFASSNSSVISNIKNLSKEHTIIMPSVPVYGNNIFNKDFMIKNRDEIINAYDLLADSKSKEVFKGIIDFQITGNLNSTFSVESKKDEAYSILNLSSGEKYFDLGAYRGDTIDEFLKYSNNYDRILAVEPDTRTFKKLSSHCENLENTTCLNNGVWSSNIIQLLDDNMGRGTFLGKGQKQIETVSVDYLTEKYFAPTFINCDIEGAENEMLNGAYNTLKTYKPKLCISAYHRSEDIFYLVNKINEINNKYKIYLRHHPHISFWDTNLYCI